MLRQVINIDKSGGCDTELTAELYGPAGYIAGFIINVNSASGYIDVFIDEGYNL